MKKPITITKAMMDDMCAAFMAECERAKLSDGRVNFAREYKLPDGDTRKAHIHFTMEAYQKMMKIIEAFESEVAWHGFVDRTGEYEFTITDIIVYPQMVTGATVNTDQEEYTKWLDTIDIDDFNRMHMQGHSHVRMATTPSGVDLNHQSEIVKQLRKDDFYIFMIWNKQGSFTAKVFDMPSNTLFEGNDVDVTYDYDDTLDNFVKAAKEMVRTKPLTTPAAPANAAKGGGKTTPGQSYYYGQRHWWDEYDDDPDTPPRHYSGSEKRKKGGNDVYTGGVIDYRNLRGVGE